MSSRSSFGPRARRERNAGPGRPGPGPDLPRYPSGTYDLKGLDSATAPAGQQFPTSRTVTSGLAFGNPGGFRDFLALAGWGFAIKPAALPGDRMAAPCRGGNPVRGKFGIVAGLSVVSLLAAACGSSSGSSGTSPSSGASSSSPAVAAKFKACMVTDTGGIDDKSFNQSSFQGLTEAAAADHNVAPNFLPSTTTADYASNITSFIGQKFGIIVTVGFLMGAATSKGATANPGTKFAIVDFPQAGLTPTPEKIVDALTFNTVQDGS